MKPEAVLLVRRSGVAFVSGTEKAQHQLSTFSLRHFFPLITDFPMYRQAICADGLSVARDVAQRILCLPIYADLPPEEVDRIVDLIRAPAGCTS